MSSVSTDVLILGAGFGGLELATRLAATDCRVTLIDRSDGFTFGFSKLNIVFDGRSASDVKMPYAGVPGFRQEEILEIDPAKRFVRTDRSTYNPDVLVVALGADYDFDATPGFVEGGYEYYSVPGAERLRDVLPTFTTGRILMATLGVPYKCPPAPYEFAFLLHDYLAERGGRDGVEMKLVTPMPTPIPPSPQASEAIKARLVACDVDATFGHRVHAIDPARKVAMLGDEEIGYDLFIGVPVHRVPAVVQASGLTEGGTDGWIHVDPRNLRTPFDGVYAIGDCADAPVPRAGSLAENAARVVAEDITGTLDVPYEGRGICFVEFGGGEIGLVNVDFLSGPAPQAPLAGPSKELMAEKVEFGRSRRERWFGRS